MIGENNNNGKKLWPNEYYSNELKSRRLKFDTFMHVALLKSVSQKIIPGQSCLTQNYKRT